MKLGAYAVERDHAHYTAYAAKTVLAVVGTATKGPIGVATVCTSTQDFINKFGPLKPDCFGLYAGQYFLSQSSKMYYVRAASESASAASANIHGKTSIDDELTDALVMEVLEKGTYANDYMVTLLSGATENTYTLQVKSKSGIVLEAFKNMSLDALNAGFEGSYVKITSKNERVASLVPDTYQFSGGDDGISDIQKADYITAAKDALSSETVDMNLLAVPGISDADVIDEMLLLAETRGDTLFLVDPPAGLTRDGVIQWHNGGGDYEHDAFNSSYGALYYDWVVIYDSINKMKVTVPPSVVVAASYAYSDRTSEVWYAPAGLNRGLVRGAVSTVTKLSKADMELLYSDNNNINSIYEDPQMGIVIWGQKTLHREETALNRVNVRRLLNYLKRVIISACDSLTFEPNDRVTWNAFEMKIMPTLKSIQSKRGIYEFKIVKRETIMTEADIDNYRMPCMVMIRPTKAAEEIPIYFVITSTGANFNEVLEANGIEAI